MCDGSHISLLLFKYGKSWGLHRNTSPFLSSNIVLKFMFILPIIFKKIYSLQYVVRLFHVARSSIWFFFDSIYFSQSCKKWSCIYISFHPELRLQKLKTARRILSSPKPVARDLAPATSTELPIAFFGQVGEPYIEFLQFAIDTAVAEDVRPRKSMLKSKASFAGFLMTSLVLFTVFEVIDERTNLQEQTYYDYFFKRGVVLLGPLRWVTILFFDYFWPVLSRTFRKLLTAD